jgi:anti-sigma B factor antagonist
MEIKTRQREGIHILDLEGSLVAGEACQLVREAALANLDQQPKVILNLAGLDYIDSSGLGTLVYCFTNLQKAGGGLRILSPSERDMELMVLTKLATVFQVFNDEQEAVNSFFPGREIKKFDILNFVQEQRRIKESK